MFWNMPRVSYRVGQKQLSVYVSSVQWARLKGLKSEWELDSFSDVVGELIRREVERGGDIGVGPGRGLTVASDGSGPRPDTGNGGGDHAVLDAALQPDTVDDAPRRMALVEWEDIA